MWSSFRGWRRKTGVVTLVMACAMTGMWARSNDVEDAVWFSFNDHFHSISTFYGVVSWWKRPGGDDRPLNWETRKPSRYCRSVATFHPWAFDTEVWNIEFKTLTIPLTLISAYLILWKPRKQKTSDQPTNPNLISN